MVHSPSAGTRGTLSNLALIAVVLTLPIFAQMQVFLYGQCERHFFNDFGKVWYDASAVLHGTPMYERNPATDSSAREEGLDFFAQLNPPHSLLLFLPLAALPLHTAGPLWFALSFAMLAASVVLIYRELAFPWRAGPLALGLYLLLVSGPFALFMSSGQFTFLFALLTVLAWRASRRERWIEAGIVLGVLCALKLFFGLFVLWLLLTRRWRGLAACTMTGAAIVGAGLAILGATPYEKWFAMLATVSWEHRGGNPSIKGFLLRLLTENRDAAHLFVLGPVGLMVLTGVLSALVVMATMVAIHRADTPGAGARTIDAVFALLLSAALLISPLGWTYYFPMLVPPALGWLAAAASRERRMMWWTLALAAVPPLFFLWVPGSALTTLTLGSRFTYALVLYWAAAWLFLKRKEAARPGRPPAMVSTNTQNG